MAVMMIHWMRREWRAAQSHILTRTRPSLGRLRKIDVDHVHRMRAYKNLSSSTIYNIATEESEILETLPQDDLYLCPGSLDAMQGAIGTICKAIDSVVQGVRNSPMPSFLCSKTSRSSLQRRCAIWVTFCKQCCYRWCSR